MPRNRRLNQESRTAAPRQILFYRCSVIIWRGFGNDDGYNRTVYLEFALLIDGVTHIASPRNSVL